jgi:hypothetical protein
MSENKETLSSFVNKSQKNSEFDKVLGRSILVAPTEEQFELLLQRLKQQLGEGRGEVILEVFLVFENNFFFLNFDNR